METSNWKEQYRKQFGLCDYSSKHCTCKKELAFIKKQIIGKLIEDIPDDCDILERDKARQPLASEEFKQQLRDKWL
jgi:hypothetical protein